MIPFDSELFLLLLFFLFPTADVVHLGARIFRGWVSELLGG